MARPVCGWERDRRHSARHAVTWSPGHLWSPPSLNYRGVKQSCHSREAVHLIVSVNNQIELTVARAFSFSPEVLSYLLLAAGPISIRNAYLGKIDLFLEVAELSLPVLTARCPIDPPRRETPGLRAWTPDSSHPAP